MVYKISFPVLQKDVGQEMEAVVTYLRNAFYNGCVQI